MNTIAIHPQQILSKHKALEPDTTVVISLKNGVIYIDISAPGQLGDLFVMNRVFERHIDKVMEALTPSPLLPGAG